MKTIASALEREYPASLWVKPAGSLRLDIAVHLQRSDVLWATAVPLPPPAERARRRARRRVRAPPALAHTACSYCLPHPDRE